MLIKEYRIPMPMSVEEYRIAQLYMIQVSGFSPPPPPPTDNSYRFVRAGWGGEGGGREFKAWLCPPAPGQGRRRTRSKEPQGQRCSAEQMVRPYARGLCSVS